MRVAIVANELEGERTGVGRYLAGLLTGLAASPKAQAGSRGWRWGLFFHGEPFDDPLLRDLGCDLLFAQRPAGERVALWEQLLLPGQLDRWRAQMVFSPSYSLPPGPRVPGVVTLHDLSFERLPEEFGWRERWRRRLLARRACSQAARVLTDTEAMRHELAQRYAVAATRIGVVPLAVEERFRPARDEGERRQDGQLREALGVGAPYLLFLGALLDRRQPRLMLEALAAAVDQRPELELVIAGPDRSRAGGVADHARKLGVADRIRTLGYVPDAAVPPLLRGAEATLYLSSYEGYGLPPLESLACGTPAVVGPGLALDDIWPAYPYRARSLARADVVETTQRLLSADSDRAAHLRREGIERIGALSWAHCAAQWVAELRRAAGE
jgi:glycosyltransferase involved in cell wall biosynthesis